MPSPTSSLDPACEPARLLRDARWMAGLTQAEVAQRAGVTRQVISAYERGTQNPAVDTLDRLLAGCGMRLRLAFVPEPGLEDWPTRDLLELPASQRLAAGYIEALAAITAAVGDPRAFLVSGKAAARLNGACVRVPELELWFSDSLATGDLSAWLNAAGVRDGDDALVELSRRNELREGVFLAHDRATLKVRAEPQFSGYLNRSVSLSLDLPSDLRSDLLSDLLSERISPTVRGEPFTVRLVAAAECAAGWFSRDRDHLALQRAIRIAQETL